MCGHRGQIVALAPELVCSANLIRIPVSTRRVDPVVCAAAVDVDCLINFVGMLP